MAERDLWQSLRDKVGPFGRLRRIENSCDKGTPDVCYLLRRYPKMAPVSGWLELKWVPKWPLDGPLNVKSLILDQVLWQEDWCAGGGRSFTLFRVGDDHLMIGPDLLRRVYDRSIDCQTLRSLAPVAWEGAFLAHEVIRCLTET